MIYVGLFFLVEILIYCYKFILSHLKIIYGK